MHDRSPLTPIPARSRLARTPAVTGLAALAAVVLSASSAMAALVPITNVDHRSSAYGAARVEIAGNYGAPPGFGRTALEVDTVNTPGDEEVTQAYASLWHIFDIEDAVESPQLGDLTELSVWAYRDSSSVDKTLPMFRLSLRVSYVDLVLQLRAQDNPDITLADDTWTKLDLAGDAQWTTSDSPSLDDLLFPDPPKRTATLQEIADRLATRFHDTPMSIGAFYLRQGDLTHDIEEATGSLYTAFDGATLSTTTSSYTVDFEAQAPGKDGCKNGGWATTGSPWKNQGECIASFVTAR